MDDDDSELNLFGYILPGERLTGDSVMHCVSSCYGYRYPEMVCSDVMGISITTVG